MKKRARPQAGTGVQMFPFLDALICTMGALLVLLHAFARHGQVEATKKAETQVAETGEPSESLEEVRWRVSQLKEARDKTASQLADERSKLSHIEDHERRLREQFDKLRIAAAELERTQTSSTDENREANHALTALRAKLDRARQEVADARRQAQEQAVSYSVVPYEGPHSTRRRPIYIECRADAIVLQPEGIELVSDDFVGFLGPGNPLASALRGMTEYLARQAADAKQLGEPYPLLLVRPDGVQAYMAARAALHSYGSDFGYELVGADWKLSFPEPDARMAQVMREAVADARVRQREYILTSPQIAKSRSRRTYHASTHGGFSAERGSGGDGGSGDGDPMGGWGKRPGGRGGAFGSRGGTGTGGNGTGGSGLAGGSALGGSGTPGGGLGGGDPNGTPFGAGTGSQGAGGQAGQGPGGVGDSRYGQLAGGGYGNNSGGRYGETGGGSGVDGTGGTGGGGGPNGPGGAGDQMGTGPDGSRYAQQRAGGTGEFTQGGGAPGGQYDPNGSAGSGASASGGQYSSGSNGQYSPNGQSAASGNASAGRYASNGQAGAAGQAQAGARGSAGGQSGGQSQGSSSGQAGASGGGGSSSDSSGSSDGSSASSSMAVSGGPSNANAPPGKKGHSMAKTRGRDWGLPETGHRQAAATRPILVECYNDRLVILGESANEQPKEIRLGDKTQESMDEFVSDVWAHMKTWGPAGKGLYWKPTLWMEVRPGAADRYAEVKTLLDGSGLEVRERQPRAASKVPTKKTRW